MIRIKLTVRERILAIVQNAGMNLNGHLRGFGSVEDAATSGGTGGVDASVRGWLKPFRSGSLDWIELSMSPEIIFFILLDSFESEAGVVIRPPQA